MGVIGRLVCFGIMLLSPTAGALAQEESCGPDQRAPQPAKSKAHASAYQWYFPFDIQSALDLRVVEIDKKAEFKHQFAPSEDRSRYPAEPECLRPITVAQNGTNWRVRFVIGSAGSLTTGLGLGILPPGFPASDKYVIYDPARLLGQRKDGTRVYQLFDVMDKDRIIRVGLEAKFAGEGGFLLATER